MIHVGIDLGTTFSLIGYVNPHGAPALFPDYHNASEFRAPSVAHVGPGGYLVGQAVEELLDDDPHLPVARFAKLRLGSTEPVLTDHLDRPWLAEAISALILRKLRRDAETFANDEVGTATVLVPAQFGDAQRRATKDAAALAGLRVPNLIEEPVAAATYYGLSESKREQTLFVYDLGGGTFDATILQASPDGLYVLATEGASSVGGKRFDEAIMERVATDFRRINHIDPLADAAAEMQLRRFAEQVKIKLSMPGKGQVRQTLLLCGKTYDFLMTRTQFEMLVAPLIAETIQVCERCLSGASLSWGGIDKVLLVGGSTLVPVVDRQVRLVSDKPGDRIVMQQPHQAVAYGAALIAAQMAGDNGGDTPPLVQRIASCDLGMRTWDKHLGRPGMQVLIRRNTPLPATHSATFYTTRPDQTRMIFELVQSKGGAEAPASLGHFAFGPIARPRKNYPVEVTIAYDIEGLVKITARDPNTGKEIEQVIEDTVQGEAGRLGRQRELVMAMKVNE